MNPLSKPALRKSQTHSTQPIIEGIPVQDLFDKQRVYFGRDVTKPYEWRVDQLDRLTRMLKENYQRLADASCKDLKIAAQENVFEVSACIATSESAKSQIKEWMEPVETPLPKFLRASGHKGMVYREPYAVTLIICRFNEPLLLSLRPAVAPLSAGNPCILKLSKALLATDELLLELIPKYFQPEALTAVVGAQDVVTKLPALPFDFMFLTGMVCTRYAVMRAAAAHLSPAVPELGGANPAIVDETANLRDAAKKIVRGAMAPGRRSCNSPGYAVVHESVADEFVTECKKAVVELYGPELKSNSDYSRIISAAGVNRLASLIDPKKVVYRGKFDDPARYLNPAIIYPVLWSDKIMVDEIFGPILPILTYSDLGKLLGKVKSLPRPLAGYVFSRNQRAVDRVLQSLSFGGSVVNQTNIFLFVTEESELQASETTGGMARILSRTQNRS